MSINRFVFAILLQCLTILCTSFLLEGCPNNGVTPNSTDSTPPIAKMDAYGIPSDGSYTPPPYTDVDANCCDITRPVPLGKKIDLIASGEDPESGMFHLNISAGYILRCKATDQSSNEHYDEVGLLTLADVDPTPPGQPRRGVLIAQGSVRLKDFENKCREGFFVDFYQVSLRATATNGLSLYSRTKEIELVELKQ